MGALVRWAFSRGTVGALSHINAFSNDALLMIGLGMRTRAEGAARTLGTTLLGMMAPALTASAMNGAGMRASALDLTVHSTNGDELGKVESSVRARHCVVDVDPCPARVGVRRGAHEARLVFDEFGQRSADRRLVESVHKRLMLFDRPLLRGSGHVGDVDYLQV